MEHVQRNLPAILKWSLQQQTEDPTPQQPIDPEVKNHVICLVYHVTL